MKQADILAAGKKNCVKPIARLMATHTGLNTEIQAIDTTQSDGRKPGNAAESGHKPTAKI